MSWLLVDKWKGDRCRALGMCSHVICFTLCNLCNNCYLSNLNNMCNICSAHCTFVPPIIVSTGIRKVYYRPRVLTAQVFTQYKHRSGDVW